ncbi:hypothetical protein, partial [Candidatus Entotheonella palauensis]|uniref:hypothetical protein n=1 Tax=Candidatus Entotheonella palauensis TaxID=93172 RepID=UPI001C4E16D0
QISEFEVNFGTKSSAIYYKFPEDVKTFQKTEKKCIFSILPQPPFHRTVMRSSEMTDKLIIRLY